MSEQLKQVSNTTEVPHRQLAYAEEFKRLISENPGVISSFKYLEEIIKKKKEKGKLKFGDIFRDEKIEITIIDSKGDKESKGIMGYVDYYYKVRIGGEYFFVKSIPGYFNISGGFDEFTSLQKARELLKDFSDVDVIDFKLGYQDTTTGSTYFVSQWEDLILLSKYQAEMGYEKAEDTYNRLSQIRQALGSDFVDLHNSNIFYNPSKKKYVIFDVHSRETMFRKYR